MNSMNPNFRNFALWVVIFLLVLALVTLFQSPSQRGDLRAIAYSQMIDDAEQGRLSSVTVSGQEVTGTYKDGQTFTTYMPFDPGMVERLRQKGVQISAKPQTSDTPWFIALLVNCAAAPDFYRHLDFPVAADAERRRARRWALASPRPNC